MRTVTSYSLPPEKLVQAIEFAHSRHLLYFIGFAVSALVLAAMIQWHLVPRMRNWAAVWIVAAVTLLTGLADLPAAIYGHTMSLHYGISIEAWPAWFWDWTKAELVSLVIAILVLVPFYWLLRRSPQRWWLYAWLVSIPVMLLSVYADPLLIDPLFNRFLPLSKAHPELIQPIEKLLAHARINIPEKHLFEMQASAKTNSLNAYVTGFGPSRRMVLYDTIIRKEEGPMLLTTIGHELGHEALDHIPKGLAMGSLSLLFTLWFFSKVLPWWIGRWGARFDVRGLSDWASLPVLLLAVLLVSFYSAPLTNAISRHQEHQADVYSLEVTHGILPDPGEAAAQAFQVEGETDLEEPNPSRFIVFWLYSHPPIADRLRFSLDYDPWRPGHHPAFVE